MRQFSPDIRRYAFHLLIVIAAVMLGLEVLLRKDTALQAPVQFTVPALALLVLPLLGYRRFPFAAPALLWVLAGGMSFIDGQLVASTVSASIAGAVAAFLLGKLPDAAQARAGLAIVVSGAAIVVYNSPNSVPGLFVIIPVQFAMAWLAGYALRQRAAQVEAAEERAAFAERERDAAARIAVAEERARIARELHDVVAHSVSVMVLQVGAVRHSLPDSLDKDRQALTGVEQTGRAALTEMRRLLGAMRHEGDAAELAPQPGLDDLDPLLSHVGKAGLPVQLIVKGEPFSLPRAIDLSAYRIIQEGLTNALKHANADRADVTISYRPEEVEIQVRDDGEGVSVHNDLGYGLLGIRERVKIYGGDMTAGPADGGGFVLIARLPIGGERR